LEVARRLRAGQRRKLRKQGRVFRCRREEQGESTCQFTRARELEDRERNSEKINAIRRNLGRGEKRMMEGG